MNIHDWLSALASSFMPDELQKSRREFLQLGLSAAALLLMPATLVNCTGPTQEPSKTEVKKMAEQYQAADFSGLLGMEGFSDTLLQNHFKLYQGYVKNTNLLVEKLQAMLKEGKTDTPEYAELKRRFGFEFNGMRLHEYYFGNLKGKGELASSSPLYAAIARDFGSFDAWRKDFTSTGTMRGIGWVVLYLDQQGGRLFNSWIGEHEVNHPAGCKPILVMDVWEHAYMLDYQLERGKYIEAFFKNINWEAAAKRLP
jgi:Fe-Mn family superoxide dismutase